MISAHVNEEGAIEFTIAIADKNGTKYDFDALVSANWQLSDYEGNVIGDMTFENNSITESPVVLTCKDLEIGNNGFYRIFAVKTVYNSSYGTNLCAKEECRFKINNLVNFPE